MRHLSRYYPIGRSKFRLDTAMYVGYSISVMLNMRSPHAKSHYHLLHRDREQLENELGQKLSWQELPDQQQSVIEINLQREPADRQDWPQQHAWLRQQLEAFYGCFAPRIKALNAADYQADEDEEPEDE